MQSARGWIRNAGEIPDHGRGYERGAAEPVRGAMNSTVNEMIANED